MTTTPRLLHRFPGLVEMVIRTDPSVGAYRISGADSLDSCFSSSNTLFTVRAGRHYRSKSIRKKGLGFSGASWKGLTRLVFNLDDFWQAGGTYPHDDQTAFLTVTEIGFDGTVRSEGPIFVLPPARNLYMARPAFALSGTAPNVAATSNGIPPSGTMHIALPGATDHVIVSNLNSSQDLLVAFGPNQTEFTVAAGASDVIRRSTVSEILLHADGATCKFEINFSLHRGEH